MITKIDLDNGAPTRVTVELSIAQAGAIAVWAGKATPTTAETNEVYNILVGHLFNRFWEDGLAGFLRGEDVS